jgi:predicted PilT family ATPase
VNKKNLERRRNQNARKINNSDSRHRNKINIHPQNTKKHEQKKFQLCYKLEQENKHYITEARFKDKNLRADIYILDDDELWEIETSREQLEKRKNTYPEDKTYIWPLYEQANEEVIKLKNA